MLISCEVSFSLQVQNPAAALFTVPMPPADVLVVLDWDWTVTTPSEPMTHDLVGALECMGAGFREDWDALYRPGRTWATPEAWWREAHELMVQHGLRRDYLSRVTPTFRAGFVDFMNYLRGEGYKTCVVSASLSDVIEQSLKAQGVVLTHGVHSNRMLWEPSGLLGGFGPVVTSTNKRLPQEVWDLSGCKSAIIIGDTISDTLVLDGVKGVERRFSIGFKRNRMDSESSDEQFETAFDVTLYPSEKESDFHDVLRVLISHFHDFSS